MRTFRKILIANRGEIALRVMRTCREMGIRTVAVYSDADRHAPHAAFADEAVHIGPPPPRESYLRIDRIVEAARRTGADAIHPGYGFLAENAEFAEACDQAGVVWIGPPPAAIRAMGSKTGGRELATAASVPIVPGYTEPEHVRDFPILIKASAGGGGRGMRIVRDAADFPAALESARREAEKAFGDGSLLFERYVEGARHVEIQILGDYHGNLVSLFERDCSLQRRHQKVVEECPSPAVDAGLRARMGEAAVALGRKLGYASAGTVEFLLAPSGEFFFIEVNTRIQVEHPVTEMVTGLDLVRLQIEVAEGRPLPPDVAYVHIAGHSIEARLYAEDPASGFVPSTGTLHVWQPPAPAPGLRIESGVAQGSEIGIHYDSMLAKIVAHGPDRPAALRKLIHALESTAALGVRTNRDFLLQVLNSDAFREGRITTSSLPELRPPPEDPSLALAAALYQSHMAPSRREILPRVPSGYRNNPYRPPQTHGATVIGCREGAIEIELDGIRRQYHVHETPTHIYIHTSQSSAAIERINRHPRSEAASRHQTANSPMPGQVLRIEVAPGQSVRAGDPLVVLEAMKMEQTIKTSIDGFVAAILVKPGEVIGPGQKLVEISAEETNANTH